MYEAHFGLTDRPFGETVNPAASISLPSRESAARRVRYGLEHVQGPALIFGPPGSGKSLLARTLSRDRAGSSALLTFPALSASELLALLALDLGAGPGAGTNPAGALRWIRHWLADASAKGERPLLVVDDAHLIEDPSTFETLQLLLNFASAGPPDLSLLLVGSPEVLLRLPPGLADRLTTRCLLGPLTEAESAAYVLGRLAASGAAEPLFSPESLSALHRVADGLPRRLNRLADLALLIAYAEGRPSADARAVSIATREFELDTMAV